MTMLDTIIATKRDEVAARKGEIVLFLDEIHTLVGAGAGGEGAMDAGNILKPRLARGEVRPLKWRDATETAPFNRRLQGHRDEFIARYGDDAEDIAILRTDLDRDGKAERIARFRHLSGAGCGNTQVWWSVLAGDLKGVQRGPLNDQLQAFDEGELARFNASEFGGFGD